MVIFAMLMNEAFSWKEFHSDTENARLTSAVGGPSKCADMGTGGSDLIDLGHTGDGMQNQAPSSEPPRDAALAAATAQQAREVVRNAGAAFCPRDVLDDGIRNFSRRYQQHVLIESAQEYELHAGEQFDGIAKTKSIDLLGDDSNAATSLRKNSTSG